MPTCVRMCTPVCVCALASVRMCVCIPKKPSKGFESNNILQFTKLFPSRCLI